MLKASLSKVTSSVKKALQDGEWSVLFGAGAGSRRHGSFQDFCEAVQLVKELMAENDQAITEDSIIVLNGLMSSLLGHLSVEEVSSTGHPGPCLEKLIEVSLLELLMRWCCRLATVDELWRVQLRFYLVLISESPQPVLQHMSVVRPLKRILRECSKMSRSGGQAGVHSKVDEAYVQLLMQLCLLMSRDIAALEQFLAVDGGVGSDGSNDQAQCAEFAIFSYLVPFMHHDGAIGTQARDALLLCLLQAANNKRALTYIKNSSSFCVVSCAPFNPLPLFAGQCLSVAQNLVFCSDFVQKCLEVQCTKKP